MGSGLRGTPVYGLCQDFNGQPSGFQDKLLSSETWPPEEKTTNKPQKHVPPHLSSLSFPASGDMKWQHESLASFGRWAGCLAPATKRVWTCSGSSQSGHIVFSAAGNFTWKLGWQQLLARRAGWDKKSRSPVVHRYRQLSVCSSYLCIQPVTHICVQVCQSVCFTCCQSLIPPHQVWRTGESWSDCGFSFFQQ